MKSLPPKKKIARRDDRAAPKAPAAQRERSEASLPVLEERPAEGAADAGFSAASPAVSSEAGGTVDEARALASILREFDLSEIEVVRHGQRLRLRRQATLAGAVTALPAAPAALPPPIPAAATPSAPVAQAAPAPAASAPATDDKAQPTVYITSPFVGTFYRSPSPEASSFVEVGQRIKKGQVLCIIEAMKLMNEIEAEINGTVVAIMAENGQPVEYGEPLFQIRP
ncbi:MAG TPA: acetyl-CoA carboxylase biotin carboxyl carrier protein [Polyangia bacterium]|jgi:acetyl-CoA carboxylase biotin carboxyl carrier protein|nr:acetyl-CoA carboxylase biotin carboxyl carrier protein [Polyangia bacterium]